MFMSRVEKYGDQECYRYKKQGRWVKVSWNHAASEMKNVALHLLRLGINKGDKLCILADTRPEWDTLDRATRAIGVVAVGIYQTNPAEQVKYIIHHSEAKAILVQDRGQLEKVLQVRADLPLLQHIFVLDDAGCPADADLVKFRDLLRTPESSKEQLEKAYQEASQQVGPDDIAMYIYTSGTTGPPKGAMISNRNLLAELELLSDALPLTSEDTSLIWLPNSHIFQRALTSLMIYQGTKGAYSEGVDKLMENLAEVKPSAFASVPRIYEKAYSTILSRAEEASPLKQKIFNWSHKVGREMSSHLQEGRPIPLGLRLQFGLTKRLVFNKIREVFGGRVKLVGSSGAPISREILEFFHACGLHALENYGMTEATGAITVNKTDNYKFGTVGRAGKGVEIKLADDGEVLARGDVVFKGYYKEVELTAEVLDGDGWYHTGDVGVLDDEGFLTITDRKKNIIITAGGKNIAPQNIENMLKRSLYISQAMVYGDRRPYLTCLITLDNDEIKGFAQKQGLVGADLAQLAENPEVHGLIEKEVDEVNQHLARYETIKRFKILPHDFSEEEGELTPTLKVKRKAVIKKYWDLLDTMY
jgi:long-chain acyl-CoA synthetase